MNPNEFLQIAKKAVLAAGKVAREKYYQPLQVTNKGFRDLVTDADLAAQEAITSIIRTAFPDHGFLTEEEDSALPTDGPVIWIVDPIDGTANYSRGIPVFCVSIAATLNRPPLSDADVLAGVIYDPLRDELFATAAGGESQLNGRTLHATETADLNDAVLAMDWSRSAPLRQLGLDTVTNMIHDVRGIRNFASAALALAWVAAGRLDGYFNFKLMPWDLAAASLLIRNSGGRLSDISDHPLSYGQENMACLASNGRLHDALLKYMPPSIVE